MFASSKITKIGPYELKVKKKQQTKLCCVFFRDKFNRRNFVLIFILNNTVDFNFHVIFCFIFVIIFNLNMLYIYYFLEIGEKKGLDSIWFALYTFDKKKWNAR